MNYKFKMMPLAGTISEYAGSVRLIKVDETKMEVFWDCNESIEATIDDIRKPALMRWSIEQCFNECKQHLGMDHYEVRTWHGWRRHILLTLISHLFVAKIRKLLSVFPRTPGSAPYVESPVCIS